MNFPPFLLDQWISRKYATNPRVEFDLGSSTGPVWTLRELLSLGGDLEALLDTPVSYIPSAGTAALREEIAALEGCDPAHVLATTGGAEGLLLIFADAAETSANVVLPRPGYPAYDATAQAFGLEARHYTLRAANGFRIDPDEVRSLVDDRTGFVVVNSPHNPTGAVLSSAEMEALHDFCAGRGVQFISDQVYHPIYFGPPAPTAARLPHASVLGDFSKALCLSGLRIGWTVEPDAARRSRYLNGRSFTTVCGTPLAEKLGALALRRREAIYSRAVAIASANLARLEAFFATRRGQFEFTPPAGGLTAFVRLADGSDGRAYCHRALERGVLVVPGDCFGMPDYFRIGLAASGERFAGALERLAEVESVAGAPAAASASL
jgi:aspartate/methionine/tyrosine aminotransferase